MRQVSFNSYRKEREDKEAGRPQELATASARGSVVPGLISQLHHGEALIINCHSDAENCMATDERTDWEVMCNGRTCTPLRKLPPLCVTNALQHSRERRNTYGQQVGFSFSYIVNGSSRLRVTGSD
ncbi:hypothetical protein ECG_09287 [Echinococcus granulosus]|nr:hypothetical protein ECG_09287 [Echinococcus granulosus]